MMERVRRRAGRGLSVTALVLALVAGFAGEASGATIGQAGGMAGVCTGTFTLADISYVVPDGGGTITSFTFASDMTNRGQTVDFLVLRTVSGTTYTVVGRTGLVTLKGTGSETFKAHVPVAAGDILGLFQDGVGNCARFDNGSAVFAADPGQTDPKVGDILALPQVALGIDLNESANLSPVGTSVVCSPTSVRVGQATTCTATVTGSTPPSGTVAFAGNSSGSFSPATCSLVSIGGNKARCSVTYTPGTLGSGTATVYASYSGDPANPPSRGSTTVAVTAAPSATALGCSPGTVAVGQLTTCTATVTGGIHPSGTVTFASNASGRFSSKTCTLVPIGGNQARCSVTYTPTSAVPSTHKVYAAYSGDAHNPPSHTSTTIAVHL